jgi:signal transduction histidine kinase
MQLRRLPRPSPQVIDVAIALAVYAATIYPSLRWSGDGARWLGVPFATFGSLPLIWRRRWPIPVALLTGISTTALSILQVLPDLPYGQLVATYTIAELSQPLWRLAAAIVTAAGIVVSLAVPDETPDTFGYVGLTFVTAYALGAGVRNRRDRIAMLEERTRRLEEEQNATAARERARIARDMHDVLAHSVGLMVVQAEGGAAIVQADPVRATTVFDTIAETGREALVQLRHTLGVLKEQAANGPDDVEALLRRARNTGLDASFATSGTPHAVPGEVGAAVYRLVQEALTNVVKHAGARRVAVTYDWSPDALTVTVVDDGRGPATPNGDSGHGLVGMRERIGACGGSVAAGPGPGGGFLVRATLPIRREKTRA